MTDDQEKFPVPSEPTVEMIEAALKSCGFVGRLHRDTMALVRDNLGGPHEPGICSTVRAVLAHLRGVPLDQIKRGYNPVWEASHKASRKRSRK